MLRGLRFDERQRPIRETDSDDAGQLKSQPFRMGQPIESRLKDACQRRRNLEGEKLFGHKIPAHGGRDDRTLVNQHLDQFFHVEGVAVCAIGDQVVQHRRDFGQLLQQLAG